MLAFSGQIYIWTDKKGVTHVSDEPPQKGVEIKEIIDSDEIIPKQPKKTPDRQLNKPSQVETPISKQSGFNCRTWGYKFGFCGTISLHGLPCDAEDDVVIPSECEGKQETNIGIRNGVEAAYNKLGLLKK